MTDPIADLLTRIRNAIHARHDVVLVPSSKIKEEIVRILKDHGFISQVIKEDMKPQAQLKIFLKYDENRKSTIHHLVRVSKPGGRVYRGYDDLPSSLRGMGIKILSTPRGILTDKVARKEKIGGEVLCEVW